MVCSQCGAYSETNTKYCSVCGAPLPAKGPGRQKGYEGAEDIGRDEGWNLVRAPKWPKPDFDLNKVDEQAIHISEPAPEQARRPTFASARTDSEDSLSGSAAASREFDPQPAAPGPVVPGSPPPYAKVGGYEERTTAYQGSFGRAPQRSAYYEEDEGVLSEPYRREDDGYQESAPIQPQRPYGGAEPYRGGTGYAGADDYDDDGDIPDMPAGMRGRTSPAAPTMRRSAAPAFGGRVGPKGARGPVKQARSKSSSIRGGGKRNTLIFAGAAGVLVVLLIVFGVIAINKNYGSIGGFFSSVFGGSPITKPAEVSEGLNEEGVDCWVITVYAREGNVVTLRVDGEEKSGEFTSNGFKTLRIPKHRLLPETPWEGAAAELVPDIRITTKDGEIIPLEIDPPITVNVPTLNLQVATPSGSPAYVNRSKVQVSGTVDDGEVAVSVEGQALAVDENGNFSGEYTLPDKGVYALTIEARKNGYQIARQTINVDYTVAEAEIDLERASLRTDKNSDKTTVKGSITAGAAMQLSAPGGVTVDTPTVDGATGAFSFNVTIDSEGSYDIAVTLTKDGASTSGVITVERAPDVDTYSRACQPMDYGVMTSSPSHSAKYLCVGTIAEVLETEPYTLARLTTDVGDVMVEYHGTAASIEAGDNRTYNIYGDYKGIHEETGLPLIYCWFIIKPSR